MNVLLVSPQMKNPNGGIAVWTDTYLGSCSKYGINCELVNTATVGKRAKNGNAKRNFLDEFVRTKRIFKELKQKVNVGSYDVAHINTSCGSFGIIRDYFITKQIRKRRLKVVLHFHCDIPFQIRNRVSKYFLTRITKLSDVNLVLCESSQKYLKKEANVESEMVPNYLDEAYIAKKPKEIRSNIERVFFVGRVELAKGATEIYELARRLPNLRFELAGDVSEEVARWDRPRNVSLLGRLTHDEVLKKMDSSDIFLFPTHSEGFSIALLESMARGLPSITTDVGANRDMLESFGGVVLKSGDVNGMERAFLLLSDPARRTTASEWLIKKVKNSYTVDVMMSLLTAVYFDGATLS